MDDLQRYRLWTTRRLLIVLVLAAACSKTQKEGSGLVARVNVHPEVQADCVTVAVRSPTSGPAQETNRATRAAQLDFGIGEGSGLTGTVTLTARGYLGDCTKTPVLNAESDPVQATFKEGTADQIIQLELKAALNDSDSDGFRSADAGGPDCDDTNAAVNPLAMESCTDGLDDDCNGRIDCADSPVCDGTMCDDGQACTSDDRCRSGICLGLSTQCNSAPGGCFQLPGHCLEDGGCDYTVIPGTPCDGGICASNGKCVPPGTEVDCNDGIDNDNDMKIDCADSDCLMQHCDDGLRCTDNDACQANGTCAGTARMCNQPPGQCFDMGTCQPATGSCNYPVATGRTCDDGNLCTTPDKCIADGGCAGPQPACNTPPGICRVQQGMCSPTDGMCKYPPTTGATCSDSDPCSFNDRCSDAGACIGTAYSCNNPPPCHSTSGTCQGDGGCNYGPTTGGTCNSGQGFCVMGTCQALKPFAYNPSNFSPPDSGWVAPVHLSGGCVAEYDSTTGLFPSLCGQVMPTPRLVQLSDANQAALLRFSALIIDGDAGFRVHGGLPVIIAVEGDAFVAGVIDGSSKRNDPGPGGNYSQCFTGGTGGIGLTGGSNRNSGGGGGGFGTTGSAGADEPSATGGSGGAADNTAGLVPLRGGCPGGGGGNNGSLGASGGGGLQLSVSGTLTLSGSIHANGAGGQGAQGFSGGGDGAGSGGGVLLEADSLVLTSSARVLTNGGGGAEGASGSTFGNDGENGHTTNASPADGGSGASSGGGDGAPGAAGVFGAMSFVAAGSAVQGSSSGGGGGGGVGKVVLRAISACMDQATISGRLFQQDKCP